MKKNTPQTIIEKIEILDESTGQIILKHRTKTIDPENQYKSDEDDDLNDFENSTCGDNDQVICVINYPHSTILSKASASQLEPIEVSSPDGKGSLYRCPLCPIQSAYYNPQASKVMDHIRGNKHFGIAVKHRGWIICKCDDTSCDNLTNGGNSESQKLKSHRHCPHCGRLLSRRNDFIVHIDRCCPSITSLSSTTNATTTASSQQSSTGNTIKKILQARAVATNKQPTSSSTSILQQQLDETDDVDKLVDIVASTSTVSQTSTSSSSSANDSLTTTTTPQQTYIYVISSSPSVTTTAQTTASTVSNVETFDTNRLPVFTTNNKRKADDNGNIDEIRLNGNDLYNKLKITSNDDINYQYDDDYNKTTLEYIDDMSSGSSSSLNVPQSTNTGSSIVISKSTTNNNDQTTNLNTSTASTSGLSAHIVQNYSILAQEITAPLENDIELKSWHPKPLAYQTNKNNSSQRAQKDIATCQFCGRAMLKKNIPTHIRRAHTPKEELVCINEEQNIFTLQHLKPGQRRKRSARAYDYSLMTATVSIDEDPSEGIENKFITEGEEILSTDLLQLADRIKFGISQISTNTLTKLIDILTKIEYSTTDEICSNAKTIKNMIVLYLTSSEEYKYKVKQIGDEINEKKKQVSSLRADLKEVMTRKAQLERRIQPIICELQKLEDQHGSLIESIMSLNGLIHLEIIHEDEQQEENDKDD